jgi:hypothetical protein
VTRVRALPPIPPCVPLKVTPAALDRWADDGWIDLRSANIELWQKRFQLIAEEIAAIPEGDTSSRLLRNRDFWHADNRILPGKVVGWVFSFEERGARGKD